MSVKQIRRPHLLAPNLPSSLAYASIERNHSISRSTEPLVPTGVELVVKYKHHFGDQRHHLRCLANYECWELKNFWFFDCIVNATIRVAMPWGRTSWITIGLETFNRLELLIINNGRTKCWLGYHRTIRLAGS